VQKYNKIPSILAVESVILGKGAIFSQIQSVARNKREKYAHKWRLV